MEETILAETLEKGFYHPQQIFHNPPHGCLGKDEAFLHLNKNP